MNSLAQLPFDFSLKDSFSFDEFVIADANVELVKIFRSEESLSEQFYFIWGLEGVGKTHLLQSLCQKTENSVCVSLKDFSEYGPQILQGLENMDLVCLDDIESILDERAWEEALFSFFNIMREQGKRLLISASSPPRGLKVQLADLSSRLSWGVVYQVHELEDTDKEEALKRRIAQRGIPLKDDVLAYILLRSSRNIKSLLSVLDTLDKLSLAEQRRVTIPFVKDMMGW